MYVEVALQATKCPKCPGPVSYDSGSVRRCYNKDAGHGRLSILFYGTGEYTNDMTVNVPTMIRA